MHTRPPLSHSVGALEAGPATFTKPRREQPFKVPSNRVYKGGSFARRCRRELSQPPSYSEAALILDACALTDVGCVREHNEDDHIVLGDQGVYCLLYTSDAADE